MEVPAPESLDKLKELKSKRRKKIVLFFNSSHLRCWMEVQINLTFRNKSMFTVDCPVNTF